MFEFLSIFTVTRDPVHSPSTVRRRTQELSLCALKKKSSMVQRLRLFLSVPLGRLLLDSNKFRRSKHLSFSLVVDLFVLLVGVVVLVHAFVDDDDVVEVDDVGYLLCGGIPLLWDSVMASGHKGYSCTEKSLAAKRCTWERRTFPYPHLYLLFSYIFLSRMYIYECIYLCVHIYTYV